MFGSLCLLGMENTIGDSVYNYVDELPDLLEAMEENGIELASMHDRPEMPQESNFF